MGLWRARCAGRPKKNPSGNFHRVRPSRNRLAAAIGSACCLSVGQLAEKRCGPSFHGWSGAGKTRRADPLVAQAALASTNQKPEAPSLKSLPGHSFVSHRGPCPLAVLPPTWVLTCKQFPLLAARLPSAPIPPNINQLATDITHQPQQNHATAHRGRSTLLFSFSSRAHFALASHPLLFLTSSRL